MSAPLNPQDLFDLYVEDIRRNPPSGSASRTDHCFGATLVTRGFRFVSHWSFAPDEAAANVHAIAHEDVTPGQKIIWRIYDRDNANELIPLLEAEGFTPNPSGRLMVYDLAGEDAQRATSSRITIEAVTDVASCRAYESVSSSAFNEDGEFNEAVVSALLDDPGIVYLLARFDGHPAGASRIETPPSSTFAGLLGGGVHPDYRRRGVYAAMVAQRLDLARRAGYRYVCVDANAHSGPRLEAHGFQAIAHETTWVLDHPA